MRACTIIAKNYLAQARVLAESFLAHNPGGVFSVLIIDELDGLIDPAAEPFTIVSPGDIDCAPFADMAARYDVLELSTAVKPWLLRQQLRVGDGAATYLDPDIQVFGSLEALDRAAREHGLALTPHNTEPIPDDGKRPSQIDIMVAGVYNLGYISIADTPETGRLLDWWSERLTRDCRVDPVWGYFVDQRWFDLAPGFVSDYAIIREPQYNVAYWNAHTRPVHEVDGGLQVGGRPLAFFHFSGFDPGEPGVLSRHQDRISLSREPVLRRLCSEYARLVHEHGFAQTHGWAYTYNRLPDGTAMTTELRALYARGADEGALTASPFTAPGAAALLAYGAEPAPGARPHVNRALAAAHRARADVRERFPDLSGESYEPFLRWAADHGGLGLPAGLLPRFATPIINEEPLAPIPWGVNVVGYFRSELGVGEAARQAVSALDAVGLALLPVHGATIPLSRQGHHFQSLDVRDARYPVNLICMNADALPEFGEQAGPSFFANRYSIGLWFWEVTAAPVGAWDPAFALLDEVWAPTRHVAEAVRSVSPIRVEQITLPIEMGPPAPVPRSALGLPEGHMFLFSFDYLSVFARKNPLAVVEAYRRAFPEPDEAVLVIKSINHEHDPDGHARLREAALGRSDIVLIDRYLDPALKDGLMAACDSYVSLHRSEGFGLTMAEAMYLGKPVIATGYSGNLDFMTDDNSYLVDFDLVGIGAGAAPYPPDGSWAQPRVEHAALLMREVYDDPEAARARGDEAARSVRETHSARVAGERMLERLEAVRGEAVRRPPAGAIAPELPGTVARGPIAPSHSAAGPVGPALRKAVLRVMKPFSSFQMTVNDQLVRSVSGLERELRRVGDAQQHAEAAQLATARRLHREIDDLRHDEAQVAGRLGVIEYEQSAVPHMEGDPFTLFADPVAGRVQGYDAPDAPDASDGDGYRSFEDIFRGSEEFIRSRQERFLALIGDREPVLDVGCGRGELLDLLRDRSIAYVGVDSDPDMVARCHEKGHDGVLLADGVQYLAAVEPGSLGVVFAAQLIEHLPYEALERFFALSRQALAPDGLLIAETVNPHSVPALRTFWVDLTHQHPIFPEVALAMSRSAGFEHAFVFHPNGTGDVEADRHRTGEYALVASPVSTERERTA